MAHLIVLEMVLFICSVEVLFLSQAKLSYAKQAKPSYAKPSYAEPSKLSQASSTVNTDQLQCKFCFICCVVSIEESAD